MTDEGRIMPTTMFALAALAGMAGRAGGPEPTSAAAWPAPQIPPRVPAEVPSAKAATTAAGAAHALRRDGLP